MAEPLYRIHYVDLRSTGRTSRLVHVTLEQLTWLRARERHGAVKITGVQ